MGGSPADLKETVVADVIKSGRSPLLGGENNRGGSGRNSPQYQSTGSRCYSSATAGGRLNTKDGRRPHQESFHHNKSGSSAAMSTSLDRIDRLLGAPDKIHIPERLAPEPEEEEAAGGREEAERRREKVESIRRLLGEGESGKEERLLTLNQLIARQVKQRSRSLAAASVASRRGSASGNDGEADGNNVDGDRSDSSPDIPLPMRQQRESFLI